MCTVSHNYAGCYKRTHSVEHVHVALLIIQHGMINLYIFYDFCSSRYQQILHRNIVYLGTIADASPDLVSNSNVRCLNYPHH